MFSIKKTSTLTLLLLFVVLFSFYSFSTQPNENINVTIINPTNELHIYNCQNITLNITTNYTSTIKAEYDNSNHTLCSNCATYNGSIWLKQGTKNLTIYMNDSSQKWYSEQVKIYVYNKTKVWVNKDTFIRGSSTYNHGASTVYYLGSAFKYFPMIWTNFSNFTNVQVKNVSLFLYATVRGYSCYSVNGLHKINHYWEEGTGSANINSETYNGTTGYERWYGDNYNFDGNIPFDASDPDWDIAYSSYPTAIYDYNSTSLAGRILADMTTVNRYYEWNMQGSMLQEWFDNSTKNYGLIMTACFTGTDAWQFVSSDGTTSQRPYFNITYKSTLPEVTLVFPEDNNYSKNQKQNFTCSVDGQSLTTFELWGNWSTTTTSTTTYIKTSYNYTGVTVANDKHNAFYGTESSFPPDPIFDYETEFTDAGATNSYINISTIDTKTANMTGGGAVETPLHKFSIKINETTSDIKNLTIRWLGRGIYSGSKTYVSCYVWNNSGNGGWNLTGNHSSAILNWTNKTFTSGFSDIVTGKVINITCMTHLGGTDAFIYTDYIEVEVYNTTSSTTIATNWSKNMTYSISGNSNTSTFNTTEIPEGYYVWNCRAEDSVGNEDWGDSNYSITIDLTLPQLNLETPLNHTGGYKNYTTFYYNTTDNYLLDYCNIVINGTINKTNNTLTLEKNNFYIDELVINHTYSWNISCYDKAGNINTSETRLYRVAKPPIFTNITIMNVSHHIQTLFDLTENITIRINITDENNDFQNATITIDSKNVLGTDTINDTMANLSSITLGKAFEYNYTSTVVGQYDITIWANNTWGIVNITIATFYVSPSWQLDFPPKNEVIQPSEWINWTVKGNDSVNYTWYNINNTGILGNLNHSFPSPYDINTSNWTDRIHTVIVGLNDSGGNVDRRLINFTIDSISPDTTLHLPANNSLEGESTRFNFTVIDANIDNCSLWHNITGTWHRNQTITIVSNTTNNTFGLNLPSNLDLNYSIWGISCYDRAGNINTSTNFTLEIDTTNPVITISSPTASTYTSTSITLDFTATDNNLDTCFYSVDYTDSGETKTENTTITCNTATTITLSCCNPYTLHAYANDTLNNIGHNSVDFTVASPSAPPTPPAGGGAPQETIIMPELTGLLCNLSGQDWQVTTEKGTASYELYSVPDNPVARKKPIYLKNKGLNVTLFLSCESNSTICNYVNLSRTEIYMIPNELITEQVTLSIKTPENATYGDVYFFRVFVTDKVACQGYLDIELRISLFGIFWKYKTLKFSNLSEEYEDANIRVLIPAILIFIFLTILLNLTLPFRKDFPMALFFLSVVASLIVSGMFLYYI